MMRNKYAIHIIAAIIALVLGYIYFSPLLEGKEIFAHDQETATGAAQELKDYYKETGKVSQWTNSMFGGMPAYTVWGKNSSNILVWLKRAVERIGQYPVSIYVLSFLGAYFCLILLGFSPWISILGALMYSMGTYFFVLIKAGHIIKILAICYIPPLLASILYAYKKNNIIAYFLSAIFVSFQVGCSHPQIVYYTGIAVGIYIFVELIFSIKAKDVKRFSIISAFLILAAVLGIFTNANKLIVMQEYTKYSTRGGSDIQNGDGLESSYILDYSYDFSEAFTAFIPRLKGGSNAEPLSENSELYQLVARNQGKAAAKNILANIPLYWGSQPIVSGPFYFGAVLIFLFVFGLFIVKGKIKYWLAGVVLISFLLSLGKYLPSLSNWLIDNMPLYNKFRDVKNIVFVQAFAMWLLGMFALKVVFQDNNIDRHSIYSDLKWATIVSGGIALAFLLIPSLAGDFTGNIDERLISSGWSQQFIDALRNDRINVARKDSFRTVIFVLIASLIIFYTVKGKLSKKYAIVMGFTVVLFDLWPVNRKYLNNSDFISKKNLKNVFTKSSADNFILEDKTLDYRVLNLAAPQGPFNDASTSYYHKSIGGYSGAKISRYQDLIENNISSEMQMLISELRNAKNQNDLENALSNLNALNMLNTKYVIYNPQSQPIVNKFALGNAWFVSSVDYADDPLKALDAISQVKNITETAIIEKEFAQLLSNKTFQYDSTARIELISYSPDKLVYQTSAAIEQLAVFSEIYYPKGWNAYIDGELHEHLRANYILRSMVIPKGEHEVVFKFEPASYSIGSRVSHISSLTIAILILVAMGFKISKMKLVSTN